MIIDHIKHISFYEPMAAGITEAWNAIQAMLQEKGELPNGRYELKKGLFQSAERRDKTSFRRNL